MRSLDWALVQFDCCPYKKGKFVHRNAQGECHVKTKTEIGVIHLQAKKYQRSLENHQK